jgi:hypothetical protein
MFNFEMLGFLPKKSFTVVSPKRRPYSTNPAPNTYKIDGMAVPKLIYDHFKN